MNSKQVYCSYAFVNIEEQLLAIEILFYKKLDRGIPVDSIINWLNGILERTINFDKKNVTKMIVLKIQLERQLSKLDNMDKFFRGIRLFFYKLFLKMK